MNKTLLDLHKLVKEHPFRINNDSKDIQEVVEDYCKETQFIYDHYHELFE